MKHSHIFVGACLSGALLAACGGSHGASSSGSIVPPGETTQSRNDGANPMRNGVIDVNGSL
ncbi:MAG: hypothetical protein WA431_10260 [Candidatus Cybelea sp.]